MNELLFFSGIINLIKFRKKHKKATTKRKEKKKRKWGKGGAEYGRKAKISGAKKKGFKKRPRKIKN